MAMGKARPGDLIEISRPLYSHWAIYVGDGYVVHLTEPRGLSGVNSASIGSSKTNKAKVKKELLSVVAGRNKYRINNKDDAKYKPRPRNTIVRKAEEMVGRELVYDLLLNNCEHFVKKLRYGVPRSNQVTNTAISCGVIVTGVVMGVISIIGKLLFKI